jgi:HSP20 family protein
MSLSGLQDEMSRLIERIWHAGVSTGPLDGQQWAPVLDLHEFDDHYTLCVEVPGLDGASVELSYLGGELTLRGEKPKPKTAAGARRTLLGERRYGTFCRTIELPDNINADKLSAQCRLGVLEVTIPKSEAGKVKSVKIDVEEG